MKFQRKWVMASIAMASMVAAGTASALNDALVKEIRTKVADKLKAERDCDSAPSGSLCVPLTAARKQALVVEAVKPYKNNVDELAAALAEARIAFLDEAKVLKEAANLSDAQASAKVETAKAVVATSGSGDLSPTTAAGDLVGGGAASGAGANASAGIVRRLVVGGYIQSYVSNTPPVLNPPGQTTSILPALSSR